MGDGIGGSVLGILSNNAFEMLITHHRKDNQEEYGKTEKIIIAKLTIQMILNTKKRVKKIWNVP